METKRPVRIGIMSFAHPHAHSYAGCLKRLPNVEFIGIADDDASRARKMAKHYEVKAFKTYDNMLNSDIDAVIVCSENVNHRKHMVYAAQHEKHVLCEKPISTTRADAEAMIEVSRRSGTKLMIAYPCRFHPAFARLKHSVDAGQVGQVLAIKATNQGMCPGDWFTNKELAGGGAVLDHTMHVLDLMRVLTGAEPVKVYAEISNRMYGGEVEDTGVLTVQFDNGVFSTIDCSWSRPKSAPFWGNVTLAVTGTNGTAEMDMFAQKIDLMSDKAGKLTHEYWGDEVDLVMLNAFIESISENKKTPIRGSDGTKALAVALAAYESAETGRPVEVL